jgi:hypothetical protein
MGKVVKLPGIDEYQITPKGVAAALLVDRGMGLDTIEDLLQDAEFIAAMCSFLIGEGWVYPNPEMLKKDDR